MTFTPGQGKILIMDDEPVIREMLAELLGHCGYRVDSVDEGSKAVKQYLEAKKKGEAYDVVILDLTVPGGMGGREVLKELLERDPQVKAVAISGHCDSADVAEYSRLGFSAVAFKPFVLADLSETLAKLTG